MRGKASVATEKLLDYVFFDRAEDVNEKHWEGINHDQNIYLSLPYLKALEKALSKEIQFYYILMYNAEHDPVALATVQMVKFVDKFSKYDEQICLLSTSFKNRILNSLDIKILVCGNVFSCGENGFAFATDKISPDAAFYNLNEAIYALRGSEKVNKETSIVLVKEFWPANFEESKVLKDFNFYSFEIDVNMVLKMRPSWNTFDDYMRSMNTKFRTKAKSVFKKSAAIHSKKLSQEDVVKHESRIEELYDAVLEKAEFNIGKLNPKAFINFKTALGEKFQITGYFLEDYMVGFSTAFVYSKIIDANYVGLDYKYNVEYAVYQKMLYDFVQMSIEYKVEELHLGRTAEEIKSGLGASPVNMKLYAKHYKTISNKLLKPIIDTISPHRFELRKPFKVNG